MFAQCQNLHTIYLCVWWGWETCVSMSAFAKIFFGGNLKSPEFNLTQCNFKYARAAYLTPRQTFTALLVHQQRFLVWQYQGED